MKDNRTRKKYGKKIKPLPYSDQVMIRKIQWEKTLKYLTDHSSYSRAEVFSLDQIAFYTLIQDIEASQQQKIRMTKRN